MVLKLSETRNETILKRGIGQTNVGNKDFKWAILNKLFSLIGSPVCIVKLLVHNSKVTFPLRKVTLCPLYLPKQASGYHLRRLLHCQFFLRFFSLWFLQSSSLLPHFEPYPCLFAVTVYIQKGNGDPQAQQSGCDLSNRQWGEQLNPQFSTGVRDQVWIWVFP